MFKALGATVAVFGMGSASAGFLAAHLGARSECAALGFVGGGLLFASHLLSDRGSQREAAPLLSRTVKVQ